MQQSLFLNWDMSTENEAAQQIIEFAPDDNSGSSSSNRFAYQKNWAGGRDCDV